MMHTIHLSVVPVRKEPSDRSEMTSQVLFGERLEILDEQEKWLMIRNLEDGYEGWIDRKQLSASELPKGESRLITSPFCLVRNSNGATIWLPAGAKIYNGSEKLKIGRIEFDTPSDDDMRLPSDQEIYGRKFLGTPYLWGGRTCTGIDCSGFTQLIKRVFGTNIPRDAYQQAASGETIAFLEETKTGDLAFFDNAEGRITHVGLIVRNDQQTMIIHASGEVREDILDHQGIFNRELNIYTHTLRLIKRI